MNNNKKKRVGKLFYEHHSLGEKVLDGWEAQSHGDDVFRVIRSDNSTIDLKIGDIISTESHGPAEVSLDKNKNLKVGDFTVVTGKDLISSWHAKKVGNKDKEQYLVTTTKQNYGLQLLGEEQDFPNEDRGSMLFAKIGSGSVQLKFFEKHGKSSYSFELKDSNNKFNEELDQYPKGVRLGFGNESISNLTGALAKEVGHFTGGKKFRVGIGDNHNVLGDIVLDSDQNLSTSRGAIKILEKEYELNLIIFDTKRNGGYEAYFNNLPNSVTSYEDAKPGVPGVVYPSLTPDGPMEFKQEGPDRQMFVTAKFSNTYGVGKIKAQLRTLEDAIYESRLSNEVEEMNQTKEIAEASGVSLEKLNQYYDAARHVDAIEELEYQKNDSWEKNEFVIFEGRELLFKTNIQNDSQRAYHHEPPSY